MATTTWKSYRAWFTHKEATPFTGDTTGFFEGRGRMMLPEPDYQVESDYNKLGSGEHGKKNELQAVVTPFSYTCDRMSEIAYLLSYFQGEADSYTYAEATQTAWVHSLKHLPITARTLPTFGFQIGPASDLTIMSGCVVNEFSITLAVGGNGKVEATFSGWGNRHVVTDGSIASLAAGALASASYAFSSEPLVNYKCCNFYMGETFTDPGKLSVNFEGEDLGGTVADLTTLLNSITFGGSNGMTALDTLRAGGCGVSNDATRGDRRYTLEFQLRKNDATIDTDTLRLADTQKSFELQFVGPDIVSSVPYAMNFYWPVAQILTAAEDDASPINKSFTTEVFENSNGDSFLTFVQSALTVGYNSAA